MSHLIPDGFPKSPVPFLTSSLNFTVPSTARRLALGLPLARTTTSFTSRLLDTSATAARRYRDPLSRSPSCTLCHPNSIALGYLGTSYLGSAEESWETSCGTDRYRDEIDGG